MSSSGHYPPNLQCLERDLHLPSGIMSGKDMAHHSTLPPKPAAVTFHLHCSSTEPILFSNTSDDFGDVCARRALISLIVSGSVKRSQV